MKVPFAIAAAAFLSAQGAFPADDARGRSLYEEHCTSCHGTSVHSREQRRAASLDEVRAWVERWNSSLKLGWTDEEITDVTAYLAATYYRLTSRS